MLQGKRVRTDMNCHRANSCPAAGSDLSTGNPGEVIAEIGSRIHMDPALCTYDAGQGAARRNDGNNRCTRNCRHNKATKADCYWKPLPSDNTVCWSIHFGLIFRLVDCLDNLHPLIVHFTEPLAK